MHIRTASQEFFCDYLLRWVVHFNLLYDPESSGGSEPCCLMKTETGGKGKVLKSAYEGPGVVGTGRLTWILCGWKIEIRDSFFQPSPRSRRKPFMPKRLSLLTIFLFVPILLWAPFLFAETLVCLDFEKDTVGNFPSGWSSRDEETRGKVYSVQREENNQFLHADARAASVQVAYEKKWPLKEFPLLRWRWRARIFPEGTDERVKSGNDNVASVYVVLGGWPIPRALKYIWSDILPLGFSFDSPHSSWTKMIVQRTGRFPLNQWVVEERNVFEDYRKLFGDSDPSPAARGIALLTDSDNTGTRAVGDYDHICILSKGSR